MLSDVEGGEEEGEEGGGHFFAAASPKSKSAAASPKGDKARPSAAKAEEGGGATSAGKEPTKKKTKKQKEEEEEEETASVTLSSLTLSDVNSPPRRVHFDERGMQDDLVLPSQDTLNNPNTLMRNQLRFISPFYVKGGICYLSLSIALLEEGHASSANAESEESEESVSDVHSPPRRVHFDERGIQDDLVPPARIISTI